MCAEGAHAERERDGGIDAAADEEENVAAADRVADLLLDQLDALARFPIGLAAADGEQEIRKNAAAGGGVDHFGMELDAEQAARVVFHRRDSAGGSFGRDAEARRDPGHYVTMAHPDLLLAGGALEQRAGVGRMRQQRQSIFAFVSGCYDAAESLRHQLLAIADAEHRDAQSEDARVDRGRACVVDTRRSARDDQRAAAVQRSRRDVATDNFRGDAELANFTRDQVTVLPAGIENLDLRSFRHPLLGHPLHYQFARGVYQGQGLGHVVHRLLH